MKSLLRMMSCVVLIGLSEVALADQFTQAEIQQLLSQLGSSADQELRAELTTPNLLPSDGRHRAILFWETTDPIVARGTLNIVAPTASRIGRKLQQLRVQGVSFTDSPTVLRLLAAADTWAVRTAAANWVEAMADAELRVWDTAVAQNVPTPGESFIWSALAASWQELRDMFIVNETTRDFPGYTETLDRGIVKSCV